MTKLPADNTSISLIGTCERKYQLTVLQGLNAPKNREAQFGDGYHKALEHIDKGVEPEDVINKVFTDAPSIDKTLLLKTLIQFKVSHKPAPAIMLNGKPMIEHKFSIPYGTFDGLQVFLEGTIDRVQINPDKDYLQVIDYKTTAGGTDYQVTKTKREYEMSFQLPFYLHALLQILPDEYKTYIKERRYTTEIWLAFYNMPLPFQKIIRPAFNDYFLHSIVPTIINERIEQMLRVVRLEASGSRAPYGGMNVYTACTNCPFRPACQVAGTAREEEILSHYPKRTYDPLNFR